ncbi:unnamed protein product [Thlaspi arvense]|uniref:Ubiquitin-like protease family profile domain-containing protein n=1 Tax=Thlaspi arvense TaxID=13288 RepID=A0AAU9RN88_THLAR|nr:unnamed protein product [Thlaspi arvense]
MILIICTFGNPYSSAISKRRQRFTVKTRIFSSGASAKKTSTTENATSKDSQLKMDITLPTLKYKMEKEPVSAFKAIDKYPDFKYIAKVKEILGPEQFKRIKDSFLGPDGHSPDDLIELMIEAGEDAHGERFSLAMMLLIETIFLHRYSKAMFPTSNLQKAQHMDKTVKNNLEKSKYPLDGFPFALHLWILESVPKLQSAFSTIDKTVLPTAFLCVKYLHTKSPPIKSVLSIEGESDVSVVHILPKIHGDLEDTMFLQDKDDEDLHSLVDLLDKCFELTHDHWRRGVLKRDDALQYIASQSYRYPHSERARKNSRASSSDESVKAKMNKLIEMFVDGQTHIRSRLSKIEQKLGIHDPSDSIDETVIGFSLKKLTHVDVSTGLDATGSRRNDSLNQMNQNVVEGRGKSQRVPHTQMGKDKVSIPLDQERRKSQRVPQTPMGKNKASIPLDKQTECVPESMLNVPNTKSWRSRHRTDVLALTQDVDAYHDNHWCRGYVQALLDGPKVCIHLHHVEKNLKFQIGDVRIHREWVDEAWDPPVDVDIQKNAETSALPTRVENISEELCDQANVNDQELKEDSPDEIIRSVISAYTVSENDDGNDGMNENETQTKKLKTKKTEKRPHNEDDLPANKKKKKGEEKSEKSKGKSAQVAEQCTATIDPFQSPKMDKLTAYKEWLEKGETARIGDMVATATLFWNMENPEARFRDTNILGYSDSMFLQEINAVLMMLQKKREEHGAYFNNDKFPRAAFCKTDFFYELLQCHDKFERYRTKLPFLDSVTNIVKGTVFPHKKWKKDVDVVYGVIKSMVPHRIGVEINFKSCQVENFSCNSLWEKKGVVLDIVRRIADMIPTLLGIAENKKPKRYLEPFKVVHHIEEEFSLSNIGFWVTDCPVYVVKMVECRSFGGKTQRALLNPWRTATTLFARIHTNFTPFSTIDPKLPRKNFKAIDQHSKTSYIEQVKEILGEVQFNRIMNSFLGALLRLSSKKMLMSGKMIHVFLTRSLIRKKSNELWFHFGSHPLRFSIREFDMVTGLKCSIWTPQAAPEASVYDWDGLKTESHSTEDLIDKMLRAVKDAYDEKFSLGMLVLIESLLFGRYKEYNFPGSFIERTQDMKTLMNYHWGRKAYELLLSSIKSRVPSHLDKAKYVLQGHCFAFHLWLLESVPMLQTAFSSVSNSISSYTFLCEKYLYTTSPSINQVLTIKRSPDVIFKLSALSNDAEDTVCMEDEDDYDLEELAEVLTRGYSLSLGDWVNKKLYLVDALESNGLISVMVHNAETFEASSSAFNMGAEIPTSSHSMIMGKLASIILMVKESNLMIFDRLHKIEEKLGIDWEDEVTESEGGYQRTPMHKGSSATGVADDVYSTEEDNSSEDKNMDNTQVQDSQPTQKIPQGATHELLNIEMIESHASEGDQKEALIQAKNSQPTILEGTPTQQIPTTQEIPEAEGDPVQVSTHEIFFTAELRKFFLENSEKEWADSNSEKQDTQLILSLTTTEPISDEDVTHKMNNDETTESSKEQEIAQTQMEKDERTQPMEEQQTVQTPPVIWTSTETVGGTEPAEMDNDDGSQEKDETTVQTPPVISTSTETVGGTEPTEVDNDDGSQEKDETIVQTPPVISTSTETVGGTEPTEVDNDDGSQEKDETTVQTPPVDTSTETIAGAGQTEVDNGDGIQEKDEATIKKISILLHFDILNVKGTHSMAIVLWQPSPSGAGNQTDEVASEKRGLSFQKDTACVVTMDTSANEESAAELQKHVKVVDMLRIRPIVANRKAKEKRVDDEGDRPAKRLKMFLRRSNRDPKQNKSTESPFKAPLNASLITTPEPNPMLDPFQSPGYELLSAYQDWVDNDETVRRLENPSTRVNGQEVDAAMMLFNAKREEHAAYFHNNRFPRAAFCNSMFFSELLDFHNIFKKPRCNKPFPENVIEVVKGNKYPNKNWKMDVDFIYGMVKPKASLHWIGLAIDMKKRRVECFSCRHPKEPTTSILQIVNDIAEMIPALLCVAENTKPMQNLVPFQVVYEFAETVAKSSTVSNCGIFVLKMIECHSVKIEDFSTICDEVVQDMMSNLVWEIFDHFKKK